MATIGTGVTYLDIANRMGPDNKISTLIEMQAQTNEILQDMVTVEANNGTGHKTTIRTGLPAATWRLLNYGVPTSKSQSAQITDTCAMLETYAQVDRDLAKLNGNSAAWRLSEDKAFLEAMNQEMAQSLFYGNQNVSPEEFTGLAPRYPTYSATAGTPGNQIVKCDSSASSTDQTSIWLVVWGENTVHAIYPKGSQAGFQHQDLGEVTLTDAAGGMYQGFRTHYKWDIGLCVRDWRYIVRIANIDTSAITASAVPLFDSLVDAYYKIPSWGMGRAVLYCNRFVMSWLHKQSAAKTNHLETIKDPAGRPVTQFLGIPFRRCDQILNTEAVVS